MKQKRDWGGKSRNLHKFNLKFQPGWLIRAPTCWKWNVISWIPVLICIGLVEDTPGSEDVVLETVKFLLRHCTRQCTAVHTLCTTLHLLGTAVHKCTAHNRHCSPHTGSQHCIAPIRHCSRQSTYSAVQCTSATAILTCHSTASAISKFPPV